MLAPQRPRSDLERLIDDAARHLPAQGPIDVFIHHNSLHAFEGERFEDAVIHAAALLGTEPFLAEGRYRDELAHGRIRESDIDAVLDREDPRVLAEPLAGGRLTVRDLRRALLLHPVRQESDATVRWTLTESDLLERLRSDLPAAARSRLLAATAAAPGGRRRLPDADDEAARKAAAVRTAAARHDHERRACADLWHACVEAVAASRPAVVPRPPPVRHRDLIRAVDPTLDTDELVHPLLIRICAAFLDQGVSSWQMPDRDRGLLEAAVRLYALSLGPAEPWSGRLSSALGACRGLTAEEVIATELRLCGVPAAEQPRFIRESLLALRGWAGMVRQLEERPDRAPMSAVPARLADFLALRLVLDRVAADWAAGRRGRKTDASGAVDLANLRVELQDRHPAERGPGALARAALLHQVAQLLGLAGGDIRELDENEVLRLEHAVAAFDATSRRRLFHLAYERRHRIMVLDGLAAHAAVALPPEPDPPPAQLVLCIDERCESFRRHVEELGQGDETFGTAGFFAVPMYYRGLDDWHASPLCPIAIRPTHTVVEVPEDESIAGHRRRVSLRRRYGRLAGRVSASSRTLLGGGLFTALAGSLAAVPLVARVAFPRLTARIGRSATEFTRGRIATRLDLFRDAHAGPLDDGTLPGFDVDEMAACVRRVLEDIGLTTRFAGLVAVIGHGSSSRNNPHESAHDCGACGGGRGGPNARAFALMANDPRVRALLTAGGLDIPEATRFVGGMLDTCSNHVTWYDLDRLPHGHRAAMRRLDDACAVASARDAHERCRRFESTSLGLAPAAALAHAEERSVDLAQVRPEYGHASNAVAVIGRRWRTRGLFLDRRAFLVSYDPTRDPDTAILTRTLAAVGPVGAGINLEYFFSTVDQLGYGAGTKLPHNITGLIGVMDGHASDLRTGLPLQMVEIHEPVRLLIVIDAAPAAILTAADRVPAVANLVVNGWVQLVSWDPETGALAVFEDGGFRPYAAEDPRVEVVERSVAWYGGRREHLPPARVLAALRPADGGSDGGAE